MLTNMVNKYRIALIDRTLALHDALMVSYLEVALLHHAISLIQHKEGQFRHVREVCMAGLHELPQPARSGHHHLQTE